MRTSELVVRHVEDGSSIIDDFVPKLHIAAELLCYSPLTDTIITITASNGSARYRIIDYDGYSAFTAVRIDDAR